MSAPRLTPMFEQYLRIKQEYPKTLLFYRMGDFFELFFEDAQTAARELSLTLTSRTSGKDTKIPMCGVPHHSADGYLAQLLEKGFTVAICDQVEDPKTAKGLVKREVTRVLTPGTLVDDLSLKDKESNYLAAILSDGDQGGLAWVDVSTGEWSGLQSRTPEALWQWIGKINPRELLAPAEAELPNQVQELGIRVTRLPIRPAFDILAAQRAVLSAQQVPELSMLGLADKPELTRACGALVAYLTQTQRQEPKHLQSFRPLDLSRSMIIDEVTERNLELFRRMDGKSGRGTLLGVLDKTVTPMGGRLLADRLRRPLRAVEPIERTQDAVGYLLADDARRRDLRANLERVRDLERLSTRIRMGRALPKDLAALRESLSALPLVFTRLHDPSACLHQPRDIPHGMPADGQPFDTAPRVPAPQLQGETPLDPWAFLVTGETISRRTDSEDDQTLDCTAPGLTGASSSPGTQQPLPHYLADVVASWNKLQPALTAIGDLLSTALEEVLPPTPSEGGLFKKGFCDELDELLDLVDHGEAKLNGLLESERAAHGLPKLKLGFNRVFGYYLELSNSHKGEVPYHFTRKQTTAGGERYITPELKDLEEKMLTAGDRRRALELRIFKDLCERLTAYGQAFMDAGAIIARLDLWQSLAECARIGGWVRPVITQGLRLAIKAGRHPVIEAVQGHGNFIPSDVYLDETARLLLITGPNMAGKSTVLRQTAIICILSQMGAYVPATSAEIGLVDRVFSRVGASDNLAMGQSTFMVEMMETARILRQAGRRSLVVLDEIGRGTSTFDGLALAWAVVEELTRRGGGIRTLFATHYHELTALEGRIRGLRNYTMAIKEWKGEIIFLRRLIPGPSDRSYGIEVARLAGVPQAVVARAKTILQELEKNRDEHGGSRMPVSQALLPGVSPARPPAEATDAQNPSQEEHPVLQELRTLDVEQLSPLAALTLLHDMRAKLRANSGEGT